MNTIPRVFFASAKELRQWLEEHHNDTQSVWLVKWKKNANTDYLSYDEIVDELLCFGWVDSLPRKLDEQRTMLLISPRNPKSNWSKVNKERIERLEKLERLHAAGRSSVNTAKANGTWDFLNDVDDLILPSDLEKALEQDVEAKRYFERFPASAKRGILEWIKNAKQESTRARRIRETVEKAVLNIKANHPRGRDSGPKDNA